MSQSIRLLTRAPADLDALATPVFAGELDSLPEPTFAAGCGFTAALGQVLALPPALPHAPARWYYGLGSPAAFDPAAIRRAAGELARAVRGFGRVGVVAPPPPEGVRPPGGGELTPAASAAAVAEGLMLGGYRFIRYKSGTAAPPPPRLDVILSADRGRRPAGAQEAVHRAMTVARAVMLARDLGNEPGGSLTPAVLAERCEKIAARSGLRCQVWDRQRIEQERLGGLLGVSRGSTQPPRLVRLDHRPDHPQGMVALVGKGVTFDSGGLSIKPIPMMFDMKYDMAGAAAVIAAMSALAELDCQHAVTGWLPLTDNMSGGDATRIGDVLRIRNGTTVEVLNADAEGRLLLADALVLAGEERPDAILDLATMTLPVSMAVGRMFAGLAATDSAWQERITAAAERAGELLWPLPLVAAERARLDSSVADLINTPHNRYGQSTLAALFLREFVPPGIAWAHLDILGPSYGEHDDGEAVAGATGYGVRTVLELLCP